MKSQITVLVVNAGAGTSQLESYPIGEFFGPVDLGIHLSEKYHGINFGIGLFAGSIFSGSNRLIVTGHSSSWGGFFISSMGGAGWVMQDLGIDMVVLTGRATTPSLLYLNRRDDGEFKLEIEAVDTHTVWHQGATGVYAMMDYALNRFGDRYVRDPRILATGPAAEATDFGAIGSAPVKKGQRTAVDTWAGRGGFGSQMLQHHGIAAIIFGGEMRPEAFRDRQKADEWFIEHYGMGLAAKDRASTKKYHYDPDKQTGGTLGSNYSTLGGSLLSFNYRSIYRSEDERLALNQNFIVDHYLTQFNEEIRDKKSHKNCGEPCAVMCKKMNGEFKKDYEPYQAMGPQIGVFDQRAAERINRHADAKGFDAIAIGGILSWLMECLDQGYLQPEDLGVKTLPRFDPDNFDLLGDSEHNANLAIALIDTAIEHQGELDLRSGARVLARKLSGTHHPAINNAFLYVANGENGWMVPNQYWTPGVLSPMPIMGKYYVYYGQDFVPPYQLGLQNAERFRKELTLDNIGMCRFHRAWAEEMIPELVGHLYGQKEAYLASIQRLAATINAHNVSQPWASSRNCAFVHTFLRRKHEVDGDAHPELVEWLAKFDSDPDEAGLAFWTQIRRGIEAGLAAE